MRVAQLSLYGYYNYGQTLQRFALQHTLKKFADFVEFLWFTADNLFPETGNPPPIQCVLPTTANYQNLFYLRDDKKLNAS